MYLKVVTTLLLVVTTAVAVRLWRPAVAVPPTGSTTGGLRPYGVWPNDPVGPDPVLEKRVAKVSVRAERMEDAVRQFGRQAGVQIVWADGTLPVMSGELIRMEMVDVTVAGGLRQLLDVGLAAPAVGTRDGVVVLANPGGVVRFYNARGLLGHRPAPPRGGTDPAADPILARDRPIERLADLIRSQVDPLNWGESGGHGDMTEWDDILIIRQSPENHRAIVRLLETLRSGGPPPGGPTTRP